MNAPAKEKANPRLSEVLAPAYADCGEQEVNDAMTWWARLSGKSHESWTMPDNDVTIVAYDYDNLRTTAHGLATVARLVQILSECGGESKPSLAISCGLNSALVALANSLDMQVSRYEN